jgi:hypothetical protein
MSCGVNWPNWTGRFFDPATYPATSFPSEDGVGFSGVFKWTGLKERKSRPVLLSRPASSFLFPRRTRPDVARPVIRPDKPSRSTGVLELEMGLPRNRLGPPSDTFEEQKP